MQLAPILPTSLLDKDILNDTSSSYLMALAQYIISDEDYREWYRWRRPSDTHLIVDNGVAEGVHVPFDQVVEAADYVGADEVVMPDVMKDTRETIRRTLNEDFMSLVPPENRMLVPQGMNWMEWTYCLSIFTDPQTIKARSIGIAKHLESLEGGRAHALSIVRDRGIDKRYDIHLLGVYRRPFREVSKALRSGVQVRGIDTGAPVAYAQHSRVINDLEHYSLDWDAVADRTRVVSNILKYGGFCERTAKKASLGKM